MRALTELVTVFLRVSSTDCNKIKFVQLVNLSHNSHVEAMWEVEVKELHNLIRGKVQIKL